MDFDADALTLITLTRAHEAACRAFAADFAAAGETEYGWLDDLMNQPFDEYLAYLETRARGEYRPEVCVPQDTFWLSTPQGDLLACGRLRHSLTPDLEVEGGHIGYGVRPSFRRRGCATRLLALMLDRARAIGLTRVLVTCESDNIGSARTIEKNGGLLEDRRVSPESGRPINRYWIALV